MDIATAGKNPSDVERKATVEDESLWVDCHHVSEDCWDNFRSAHLGEPLVLGVGIKSHIRYHYGFAGDKAG